MEKSIWGISAGRSGLGGHGISHNETSRHYGVVQLTTIHNTTKCLISLHLIIPLNILQPHSSYLTSAAFSVCLTCHEQLSTRPGLSFLSVTTNSLQARQPTLSDLRREIWTDLKRLRRTLEREPRTTITRRNVGARLLQGVGERQQSLQSKQ